MVLIIKDLVGCACFVLRQGNLSRCQTLSLSNCQILSQARALVTTRRLELDDPEATRGLIEDPVLAGRASRQVEGKEADQVANAAGLPGGQLDYGIVVRNRFSPGPEIDQRRIGSRDHSVRSQIPTNPAEGGVDFSRASHPLGTTWPALMAQMKNIADVVVRIESDDAEQRHPGDSPRPRYHLHAGDEIEKEE